MYFPLFDWEHTKQDFLKRPLLYKKGMTYSEYGNLTFMKWFTMGVIHAIIIYFALFMVMENDQT